MKLHYLVVRKYVFLKSINKKGGSMDVRWFKKYCFNSWRKTADFIELMINQKLITDDFKLTDLGLKYINKCQKN